jgi:hypothetical protein
MVGGRAYLIADNKLPLNADWDFDLLKLELGDLNWRESHCSRGGYSGLSKAGMSLRVPRLRRPVMRESCRCDVCQIGRSELNIVPDQVVGQALAIFMPSMTRFASSIFSGLIRTFTENPAPSP